MADFYDFDARVERKGTGSLKWDKYRDRDIYPLWVADMDFISPPSVVDALRRRVDHGIFGYTLPPEELASAVCDRMERLYGWNVKPEDIVWLPGLVVGLNVSCRTAGREGDAVVTAIPIYPPFLSAPQNAGRELKTVPLLKDKSGWRMDFEKMEKAFAAGTRMFLLCNPHNPTGRVFGRSELKELIACCKQYDVVLCSDEIHCDLVLEPGKAHLPAAMAEPDFRDRIITLMSPSKTYNIPGLGCSFAIIQEKDLRRRFRKAMTGMVPWVNALGYAAALGAYTGGDAWLAALLQYLRGNRDLVLATIEDISGLEMVAGEATYLAWIDCREAGIKNPASFFEGAGVGLSDGADFGMPGFVRLNFACPRRDLSAAMERMKQAL